LNFFSVMFAKPIIYLLEIVSSINGIQVAIEDFDLKIRIKLMFSVCNYVNGLWLFGIANNCKVFSIEELYTKRITIPILLYN